MYLWKDITSGQHRAFHDCAHSILRGPCDCGDVASFLSLQVIRTFLPMYPPEQGDDIELVRYENTDF